jgi:hypothetical protein
VILLRTERPTLLPRELATRRWYEEHDPVGEFGLDLMYDNAPGDWSHYSMVFREAWKRARSAHTGLINSESDITPTMEAFQQVLRCPQKVCSVPYQIYKYNSGEPFGFSATIEIKVPGGWDSHLARGGEEWAVAGDLGFVRFSRELVGSLDIDTLPPQPLNSGLLNQLLYEWLKTNLRTSDVFHLHWPALKNAHVMWDTGDAIHHPPGSELWKRDRPGDRL